MELQFNQTPQSAKEEDKLRYTILYTYYNAASDSTTSVYAPGYHMTRVH
jgi:hypothetical protein